MTLLLSPKPHYNTQSFMVPARQVLKPHCQVQYGSQFHRNIARQLPLTSAYWECNHRTGIDRTKSALKDCEFHIDWALARVQTLTNESFSGTHMLRSGSLIWWFEKREMRAWCLRNHRQWQHPSINVLNVMFIANEWMYKTWLQSITRNFLIRNTHYSVNFRS